MANLKKITIEEDVNEFISDGDVRFMIAADFVASEIK